MTRAPRRRADSTLACTRKKGSRWPSSGSQKTVRTFVDSAGSRRRASSTGIRSQVMPAWRQPSTKRGSHSWSESVTETK